MKTTLLKLKMSDFRIVPNLTSMLVISKTSAVDKQFKICIMTNNSNTFFLAFR